MKKIRKAIAGAAAAGATALVASLAPAISDGVFTLGELWPVVTLTVGGAVVGFATVYAAPANEV